MCKKIVTPHNEAPRNCKVKEFADGWCHLHHPDNVEEELVRTLRHEERQMQQAENRAIGAWVRDKHPATFEQMRDEVEKARNRGR